MERTMLCPRCAVETAKQTVHDVEVQRCGECGGMFADRGELNRLAEPTPGDLEFSTLEHETFQHEDAYGPTDCPRCSRRMEKVEFNIYTGIILDHCAHCGGFWLDGTELGKINEEVHKLNEESDDEHEPAMMWFARFIWTLPR